MGYRSGACLRGDSRYFVRRHDDDDPAEQFRCYSPFNRIEKHARPITEHASLLWRPETTDAIRAAHEGVIGQILTMNLLRIQAFWSHYRFRQQNARLNALLHQQLRMTSVISSLRRMLLNWPSPPDATREILEQLLTALASSQTDVYTVTRIISHYARPTSPTTGTSPSGSDYAIFAAFICKVVRNYIVCKAV